MRSYARKINKFLLTIKILIYTIIILIDTMTEKKTP